MNQEENLCPSCLYLDRRPESGIQGGLIYCQKKKLVVRPKIKCDMYLRATAQNRESMKASIYGTIGAEDLE